MKLGGAFDGLRERTRGGTWTGQISPVVPPRLALLEIGLLLAVAVAEYAIEGFPAISRINPHPYWIGILLLSLQYGTVSGLMAAGIAIIGTVLIGMPEPDIEERYFNYLVRVWTQPVLWLLTAMILGTFRARQIEQRDDLRLEVANLRTRGSTLLDHATNLRSRCAMLERRIATRDATDAGQLLASLGRLNEAEPGRWATALKAALAAGFPGAQLSLYAVDGDKVRHVLTHATGPDKGGTTPPAAIAPDAALLPAVIGARRALSILNPADDSLLQGHGVAAVPVFTDAQGALPRVIGLLIADRLPPAQIDASMTRRLSVIATHLVPALQQGRVTSVSTPGSALGSTPAGPHAFSPAAEAPPVGNAATLGETIPTVRRWRMLRWLPGGQQGPNGSGRPNG
jgi:hypothetical protein